MSKEIAKKLIAELQTNTELKAKIAGIEDKDELVKIAVQNGYDVTLEEMTEAEKEFRAEMAQKSDELTADELEGVAGGGMWQAEDNKEGKEFRCAFCNLHYRDQADNNEWCQNNYFCNTTNINHCDMNYITD
ncbi:MAG: Nif11-like leader peptide family RiPP precursor [Ruminiclostridium sp.]|nr:Nif11-like leader peptide family RiPP precursor [Ruminiclostridium sp.]